MNPTATPKPRKPAATPPIDLNALADLLTPLVLARMASALGAAQGPFSTRRGAPVPLEFTGRPKAWRATAPTIPGAVRIGRWWAVPRSRYDAWLETRSTTAGPNVAAEEPWTPRRALEAAGLRCTR